MAVWIRGVGRSWWLVGTALLLSKFMLKNRERNLRIGIIF
jgi:hypothetical protein